MDEILPCEGCELIEYTYSKADVPALAALHRRAFPDFFLSRLGNRFLRQLYLGYLADPDAVVTVARGRDGSISGVCVGSTEPAGFFGRLLRRRIFGFAWAAVLAGLRDPRNLPRLLAAVTYRGDVPAELPGALLSSLCVDPEAQGSGIGRALEAAWCARAAECGSTLAFLTTDAEGNEAVNSFYQRGGWTLSDQFVTPQGRRMNRYRRELTITSREATSG